MGVVLALATHTGIFSVRLFAARLLATNARMGVVVALATHTGIDGARLLVYGFLATNARMGVALTLATHVGKYGARLWVYGVLATNARMGVALVLATHARMGAISPYKGVNKPLKMSDFGLTDQCSMPYFGFVFADIAKQHQPFRRLRLNFN